MKPVSKFFVIVAFAKETVKFTHTAEEGKAQTRQCKPAVTVVCSDVTEDRGRSTVKVWVALPFGISLSPSHGLLRQWY